jgi:lysophospholipase L1-like esterase
MIKNFKKRASFASVYGTVLVFGLFGLSLMAHPPCPGPVKDSLAGSTVFVFGKASMLTEAISVPSALPFDGTRGYGFDFGTATKVRMGKSNFSGTDPVYFSVNLTEGNYRITLKLGSHEMATNTTVKAESRRLVVREMSLGKGETKNAVFTLNIRTPQIGPNAQIKLKDREWGELNWDTKLTLEFLGSYAVQQIAITPIPTIKTVFLTGDSTVTDQDLEPWASWGQFIGYYLNNEVVVANYAASGESLASFKARGRLEKVLSLIRPGDYMMIEFGHNDEKIKGDGKGPWDSYSNELWEFVLAARDKGAFPILVTPTQRRVFDPEGSLLPTHGDYPEAMRYVVRDLEVPLIDLTNMTTVLYESWGDAASKNAFVHYPANTFPGQSQKLEDNTHFNSFGAHEIALCVLKGIREANIPLADNIINFDTDYNPKRPNTINSWNVPMGSRFESIKPDGN